tara:strand:+ start:309 stop:515 length:207 start_codon:yes stop_codon:yes gene_type:complete
MSKIGILGFVIYLIVGVYFLNAPFNIIPIPGFIEGINQWIIFVGGILIIAGGINYLRAGRNKVKVPVY